MFDVDCAENPQTHKENMEIYIYTERTSVTTGAQAEDLHAVRQEL